MTAAQRIAEERDHAVAQLRRLQALLAASLERELAQFAVEASLRLQLRVARAQRDARYARDSRPVQIPQQRGPSGLRPARPAPRGVPR